MSFNANFVSSNFETETFFRKKTSQQVILNHLRSFTVFLLSFWKCFRNRNSKVVTSNFKRFSLKKSVLENQVEINKFINHNYKTLKMKVYTFDENL